VVCCGRPLYDYGMLDTATRLVRRTLEALRAPLRAGTPIVGLEPSCVAVFRDEVPELFPDDPDARRLAEQAVLLTEFLDREGWNPPSVPGRAVLHRHCHEKAVLDVAAERRLLESAGLDVRVPSEGCCGMAGGFGFERGQRYRVSLAVGERELLPAVREASEDDLIVSSGFSCRTQIWQGAGREAVHPAQVFRDGLVRRGDIAADERLRRGPSRMEALMIAGAASAAVAVGRTRRARGAARRGTA